MLQTPEFWVAVGFVILIAGIAKPMWIGATSALDSRAERIRESLDDAAILREQAQHLLAEHQRKQRDATKECEEIIAGAEASAARFATEAGEKLEQALRRREQLAIDKIAQAEAETLQHVHDTTVDIAIAATRRILEQRVDAQTGSALVDRTIVELAAKLD